MTAHSKTFIPDRRSTANQEKTKIFLAIVLVSLLLLCSCSPTVKNRIHDQDFMHENQPVRKINVMIASENVLDEQEITGWLADCSRIIYEQVGIQLKPTQFIKVKDLPSVNDISNRLTALYEIGKSYNDWDIIINIANYGISDIASGIFSLFIPLPIIQGYIDDSYRRVIVLKSKDLRTFGHEFFHAFIFKQNHSGGIMAGMTVQLLPFTQPLNGTVYLTEQDRKEVLKNKWRSFSKKPEIVELKQDIIKEN